MKLSFKINYFLVPLLILLISCSDDSVYLDEIEHANNLRLSGDLMECLGVLNKAITAASSPEIKQIAQFNIADIYMNDVKNYLFALGEFNKVLSYKIENKIHKKSLFMSAYISSNYLDMYTKSYELYNKFLKKYPEDDLVPSVKYEIVQLEKFIDEANTLLPQ